MTQEPLLSSGEIERIAKNILIESKAWGKFPTPVDDIVQFVELSLAKGVDLSKIDPGFLAFAKDFVGRISRKVIGIVDYREKVIHLDESQPETRKNFVKVHEVGHFVLPWQKDLRGCLDDDQTIDPLFDDLCEREASFFGSAALFQLERFDEEASKLPLVLPSGRVLAKKFGGSIQASLRRYIEKSPKRCAMLVFHRPVLNGSYTAKVRNYFESESFTDAFGGLVWPDDCGLEFPFVQDMKRRRKDHQTGQIAVTTKSMELLTLQYHYFDNTRNIFVVLIPPGEKTGSRVKIVTAGTTR
jgi:hypothetical protein